MANSADPDQLASSEANWSGSTLFAEAGHIWTQQDYGLVSLCFTWLKYSLLSLLTNSLLMLLHGLIF